MSFRSTSLVRMEWQYRKWQGRSRSLHHIRRGRASKACCAAHGCADRSLQLASCARALVWHSPGRSTGAQRGQSAWATPSLRRSCQSGWLATAAPPLRQLRRNHWTKLPYKVWQTLRRLPPPLRSLPCQRGGAPPTGHPAQLRLQRCCFPAAAPLSASSARGIAIPLRLVSLPRPNCSCAAIVRGWLNAYPRGAYRTDCSLNFPLL